ncbi:alpha-L-glutamate ligase-like protein [Oceanospirillum sediminis]|uniref:Alpha-L-glutamate ligase-like protein n=1 Tax=Oceanospirillum sediminis TaxID=2760088 RepID=A0A839IKP5_9GAMM|nr:alpha-L-glutamate ligase-like protein [Oceanospirillum sediminis]MBB1485079.1 alpha-L-glutamate ligase-like protein [Oceanospirillum sediminis]
MGILDWLKIPQRLRSQGVMGMNQRNHSYIGRYNDRRRYPLVDDKLKTKLLAQQAGASVPGLIGVIRHQGQVRQLSKMISALSGFVIKPAQGSGGKGILVITHQEQGRFFKPSGAEVSAYELERHVSNILAGLFSLGGKNDVALIEHLIEFDEQLACFSYEGVPDIRVVVFQGFPVMAMMRCSTAASDGKANLHQGAVGVGLDIASGQAVNAVQFDRQVCYHPDTQADLKTLQVSGWGALLELAASAWEMTELGYIGTDIVLDKQHGPMILELNARPGLAIQIANGCGLLPRLKQVESLIDSGQHQGLTVAGRVAFSREHFAVSSML